MSIIFKKNQLMFLLMVAMFVFALFQPNFAFAQEGDLNNSPIARGLCNVFELAGGNIGKAIAIFAIVAVGFGFFTGKFSIALVIGITLGIGILFGAPKIISALTGTDAVDCQNVGSGDLVECDSSFSFVSAIDADFPPSVAGEYEQLTTLASLTPSPLSSNNQLKIGNLITLKCIADGSVKKWYVSDILKAGVAKADAPITLGGPGTPAFTTTITNSSVLATQPSPAATATATLLANKICPALKSVLSGASPGSCPSGTVKIGVGASLDLCAHVGDANNPTIVGSGNAQLTNSSADPNLTLSTGPYLHITKYGIIGTQLRATIGTATLTASCGAGAAAQPGKWTIAVSGTDATPLSGSYVLRFQ